MKYLDNSVYSLHKGVVITKKSLLQYLDYVKFQLSNKSEDYKNEADYTHIIFDYFVISKDKEAHFNESNWKELSSLSIKPKLKTFIFEKANLPVNMDYNSWGFLHTYTDDMRVIFGNDSLYTIKKINENKYEIKMSPLINPSIQIVFYDTLLPLDNNQYFKREMDTSIFYCDLKGEQVVFGRKRIKTSFLKPLEKNSKLPEPKIITIDIETIVKDGIHKPYLYSMYDGKNSYSFFSDDGYDLLKFILRRNMTVIVYMHITFPILILSFYYQHWLNSKIFLNIKFFKEMVNLLVFNFII